MLTTGVDIDMLRAGVRDLCGSFPSKYWREIDEK
jgi:hypothetical protein